MFILPVVCGCGNDVSITKNDQIVQVLDREADNRRWELQGELKGEAIMWSHNSSTAVSVGHDLKRTLRDNSSIEVLDVMAKGTRSSVDMLIATQDDRYGLSVTFNSVIISSTQAESAGDI